MKRESEVFIVDDDEDDRLFIEETIVRNCTNCKLQSFEDGGTFLSQIGQARTNPTLIVLDLNMPGIDGFEVLTNLKANQAMKDVPVIIFTTSSNEVDKDRANTLGAALFITKPQRFSEYNNIFQKYAGRFN
ncbi:response regulator [Nibrella saemangeumensis]|uniref:Response regulator n=1 Tax=Nibrella saemangeumensis TaxID=1084526 RepID=A0ABP8MCZ3_9BACT